LRAGGRGVERTAPDLVVQGPWGILDRVADHANSPAGSGDPAPSMPTSLPPTGAHRDGLRLRVPTADDTDDLVRAAGDPDIAAAGLDLPASRADADAWFARPGSRFLVTDGTAVLGGLELRDVRPGTGNLTCWVAAGVRRRGVATRAVRELAGWALPTRVSRLELVTDVTNVVAHRVALAAGFTREGIRRAGRSLPNGYRADEVVWSRLPGDPPGPRPRPLPDLPGGELTDGTVRLRPITTADAGDMEALLNLPDVARRQVPPGPTTSALIAQRCAYAPADWLIGSRAALTIRDAASDAFAGEMALVLDGLTGEGWIGYSLLPAWRGRGMTKRAVRLLSRWALSLGVARLCAGTMPDNVASQRVLEATGFTLEGVRRAELPGPGDTRNDDHVYVLLALGLAGRGRT
jgi:RimJ/RimL family protein N-acetyltransferase